MFSTFLFCFHPTIKMVGFPAVNHNQSNFYYYTTKETFLQIKKKDKPYFFYIMHTSPPQTVSVF